MMTRGTCPPPVAYYTSPWYPSEGKGRQKSTIITESHLEQGDRRHAAGTPATDVMADDATKHDAEPMLDNPADWTG